jgi:plasmid stability protein
MANTPVSIRLPEDLRPWLDMRAAQEHRSLNNMIVVLLEQARAAENSKAAEKKRR